VKNKWLRYCAIINILKKLCLTPNFKKMEEGSHNKGEQNGTFIA